MRSPLAKEGMFTHAAAKKSMKKLGAKKGGAGGGADSKGRLA